MLKKRRQRVAMKLPKGLPSNLAAHSQALKAVSLFLELKPLFYSSVITAPKGLKASLYAKIGKYADLSANTVRSRLNYLLKKKLIWYDDNNNLYLASTRRLAEAFGNQKRFYYNIPNTGNTELILRAAAIEENIARQSKLRENKIFAYEVNPSIFNLGPSEAWDRQSTEINSRYASSKSGRKLKKSVLKKREQLEEAYQQKYQQAIVEARSHPVNMDATLSCKGVAYLFGRSSSSTGYYWEQKLAAAEKLSVKNSAILLPEGSVLHQQCTMAEKGFDVFPTGTYSRTSTKGKKMYFLTLPNKLKGTIQGLSMRII